MVAIKLSELKKGEYFTRKPVEYPTDHQVLIRGEYDRTTKKYENPHFDDAWSNGVMLKGSTVVYTGFTF